MLRSHVALPALVFTLGFGSAAWAEPATPLVVPYPVAAGTDLVVLRNGGMIRGTLIELLPNDHVTVQLPTGQAAIIQWGEIHHVERGAPAGAATALPPASPPASRVLPDPKVMVHIDAGSRAVELLYNNPEAGYRWDVVCTAPCDAMLPLRGAYRIKGDGIHSSKDFVLQGQAGQRIDIVLHAGTKAGVVAGGISVGVGAVAAYFGVVTLLAAAVADRTGSDGSGAALAGTALTVGGLGGMVVGTILLISNASTGIEQQVLLPVSPTNPNDAVSAAPTRREPSWRGLELGGPPVPAAAAAPVFSVRF